MQPKDTTQTPQEAQTEITRILEENRKRMMGYALRLCHNTIEAEDLVQDAMRSAYAAISAGKYDASVPMHNWLYHILRSKFPTYYNKQIRGSMDMSPLEDEVESSEARFEDGVLERIEADRFLREALEKLTETETEEEEVTEAEAAELASLVSSIEKTHHRVVDHLDNIHCELRDAIEFSRALRDDKETAA